MELKKKEKLKIGILINSYRILNWQLNIIEQLINSTFSNIRLVIKINESAKSSNLITKKNKLIYNFHLKIDELVLARNTDYSKTFNSKALLEDVEKIELTPIMKGQIATFNQESVEAIRSLDLDIILKFCCEQLTGELSCTAKYGIWSYEPDSNQNKQEPLGYWEVVNSVDNTSSVVQILNKDGNDGKVIYRSQLLTNYLSINKNRNACYWRAATAIPHIIEGLYKQGDIYIERLAIKYKDSNNIHKSEVYKEISTIKPQNMFIHFSKVGRRFHQKMISKDHWDVLYTMNGKKQLFPCLNEYKLLATPADRFWADPFVVSRDCKNFIFVEELLYKTNKGHIAVIELDSRGNFLGSRKVLECNYHLSYPFVFEHDNTYYMIPETGGNKTIELYRCKEFPYQWEFIMNLMENVNAADATLFYHNNRWWLFCCLDKTNRNIGMLDELHLFYSDTLFTQQWHSHPSNPINTDTRTARPAGKIFIKDGKIFRPSQDCSGIYGKAINLNRIVKLNEKEYEETVVSKLLPDEKKFIGTHTFNSNDSISVIDGFRYRKRNSF
jgi:hypothetical protein